MRSAKPANAAAISFPEAAILLVSDGSRFFQRMTKGTPGDEVDAAEASRARKQSRAVVPETSRFSCWARKLPIWRQEVTPGKKMWELLAHRTSMDISMGQVSWNIQIFFQSSPVCSWAGLAKTTRGYVAWYLEFKVLVGDSIAVSWVNPCKEVFGTRLVVGIIWKVSTYLHWQWFVNHAC